MALNIDKVYRFVQFVSNKESRGWVSPSEFNLAAESAQLLSYTIREQLYKETKKIAADLRPFRTYADLSDGNAIPSGFRIPISCYGKPGSGLQYVKFNEIDEYELTFIKNSELLAPSDTHPIICFLDNSRVLIYPSSVLIAGAPTSIEVRVEYLKLPSTPSWAYTTVSGRPVYASGTSVDFEFDESLFFEISSYILSNIGVNVKDEILTQYAMSFNK